MTTPGPSPIFSWINQSSTADAKSNNGEASSHPADAKNLITMVDADVKASREDLTAPDASETEAVRTTETETHTALPVDTERMIDHAGILRCWFGLERSR